MSSPALPVRRLDESATTTTKDKPMKTTITSTCATLLLVAACLSAAEPQFKTRPASPEFERLKSLVGTWEGTTDIGQGPVDLKVQFRLLAGGTVLEERCFAGTPNEMITMYYEQGDKLALTHYCVMGNRPGMLLKASDTRSLTFDFDATCGINVSKESHMHALKIQFDDADTVTTSCKAIMDGKELPEHPTTLKRVKST
jgi:hypothetical protein